MNKLQIVYRLYLNHKIWPVSAKEGSKYPKNGQGLEFCFGTDPTQKKLIIGNKNTSNTGSFIVQALQPLNDPATHPTGQV